MAVMINKRLWFSLLLMFGIAASRMVCTGAAQEKVSPRACVGHENDQNIQNYVRQYPKTAGTRLDNCQTCHRSGLKGTDTDREFSPCAYCHLLQYPNSRYNGAPKNFEQTLNAYGIAYKQNGRTAEALAAISKLDSDGDGFVNAEEIADLRNPGDPASRLNQDIDHNAGFCVRGATVITVNPIPDGFEEFDWNNSSSLIADGRIVIYRHWIAAK